jgi:hypothetical protein
VNPVPLQMLLCSALVVLACQPQDRRPGQWLRGERVREPVTDWSFSDAHPEIAVETRTWYGIPHSVTTVCVSMDEDLYVPSVFDADTAFPDGKFWTQNVLRDRRVRLKIGERLYEREAVLVTDEREFARAFARFAGKYDFWRDLSARAASERPRFVIWRMQSRGRA